jgi:hypothetical protein
LSSQRHEVEVDDVMEFTQYACGKRLKDGLPLVPSTETACTMLAANNRYPTK